jgi:XTP/dITP diphosphohydrolase
LFSYFNQSLPADPALTRRGCIPLHLNSNMGENSEIISLVFATGNVHKTREIQQVIGSRFRLLNLTDLGFTGEIPEEQDTLEGNSAQKAWYIFNKFQMNCFADDTGLEIEALQGEPGVYSARYAGPQCSFEDNMNKVLAAMSGMEDRKARFRTVIALIESGNLTTFQGEIRGTITREKKGGQGFGYDPIFLPEGSDRTFAEMDAVEKNRISHRALAVQKLIVYLNKKFT